MGLSFICPVCNQKYSFLQKTGVKINGNALCGDCAEKRGNYEMGLYKKKLSQEEIQECMKQYDQNIVEHNIEMEHREEIFLPTDSVGDYISFDDSNRLFTFPSSKGTKSKAVFSYDELLKFDVLEDGDTITSGGLGKALVGGAFFGLAGVVAGGTSKKQKKYCDTLQIKITTTNANVPIVYLDIIKYRVNKNSFLYKDASKVVQNILSKFEIISSSNEVQTSVPTNNDNLVKANNTFSVADEIKKYKELLDMDAITKEEYEKKKKELLGK